MADEERRGKKRSRRNHRSKRSHRSESRRPSLVRRFWFEIVTFLLLAAGIFLLVERLEIKQILWQWICTAAGAIAEIATWCGQWIARNVISVQKSDLVGGALILVALLMIAFRLRGRAISRHPSPALKEECPRCKADMVRAPRRMSHRLLELFLWIRIRRYACSKCSFRTASWHRLREEE